LRSGDRLKIMTHGSGDRLEEMIVEAIAQILGIMVVAIAKTNNI